MAAAAAGRHGFCVLPPEMCRSPENQRLPEPPPQASPGPARADPPSRCSPNARDLTSLGQDLDTCTVPVLLPALCTQKSPPPGPWGRGLGTQTAQPQSDHAHLALHLPPALDPNRSPASRPSLLHMLSFTPLKRLPLGLFIYPRPRSTSLPCVPRSLCRPRPPKPS